MKALRLAGALARRFYHVNVLGKRLIPKMLFEVCSACQNRCEQCAHGALIEQYGGYQLSMDELASFITTTKESGYYFKDIQIHGAGEPTLWKHFNEGVELLYRSNIVNRILVTTNALSLDKIAPQTWEYLFAVSMSIYPESGQNEQVTRLKRLYGDKIWINDMTEFSRRPDRKYENTIPCECTCQGPMFIKDKVFLYCGPPVYDAAKVIGRNAENQSDLWVPLRKGYLDNRDAGKVGNMDICQSCWANSSITRTITPHTQLPRT